MITVSSDSLATACLETIWYSAPMCGRYSVSTRREALEARFHARTADGALTRRYNAAPSDALPVILNRDRDRIVLGVWGFTPEWAKDKKMTPMINARAESVPDKPFFRDAFRSKRCLVLADGFYEWKRLPSGKQPYRITLKSEEPFAFAGVWSLRPGLDGEPVPSFAIITTAANERVAEIHNRMPVILLAREREERWLDGESEAETLKSMLIPYPAAQMRCYPVSTQVNRPENDSADLIRAV